MNVKKFSLSPDILKSVPVDDYDGDFGLSEFHLCHCNSLIYLVESIQLFEHKRIHTF